MSQDVDATEQSDIYVLVVMMGKRASRHDHDHQSKTHKQSYSIFFFNSDVALDLSPIWPIRPSGPTAEVGS